MSEAVKSPRVSLIVLCIAEDLLIYAKIAVRLVLGVDSLTFSLSSLDGLSSIRSPVQCSTSGPFRGSSRSASTADRSRVMF
jgi:hypothetical protein